MVPWLKIGVLCLVLLASFATGRGGSPAAVRAQSVLTPAPAPWRMFHHDERHTGVALGIGSIDPATGPVVRWKYRVTPAPSEAQFDSYRWYSSFPLGDLDGDGTLEVVVTTPDNSGSPDRVIVLKDRPGHVPPVSPLWTFTQAPPTHEQRGFDQYSSALADADGDGLLDVLFTSKDGWVRALKGTNGSVIWQYQTDHFIEAGPVIADLDGDRHLEVVVVTDCQLGNGCPGAVNGGALYVFAAHASGTNQPLWSRSFPWKLDSSEPAVVDLDAHDGRPLKQIILGSWGARLIVVWRNPDATTVVHAYNIHRLDPTVAADAPSVIRSTPLVGNFGRGLTAVFGWMPDWRIGSEARISAVTISTNTLSNTVRFTPRWTLNRDDWKSSVALLPIGSDPPLVVTGYGIGTDSGTANYGRCSPVSGGVVAVNASGQVAWEHNFGSSAGNVRGSPAVADIDGDGRNEVLLTVGCYGRLYAYDGTTGQLEWSKQLGPRTIGSPSIGDLNGDGKLEIVVGSYDGNVWALGGQ